MSHISPTVQIIEDAKNGKPFILVDSETRENEGDLVLPAEFVTPEFVNFMIKNCSGIICLTITKARAELLGLKPMVENNMSAFATPFTASIEAKSGVSTGVSAFDRVVTIKAATAKNASMADIVSPGHIFPLVARDGGVLARAGHTEASVDICKLAGLSGFAIICEVMNEDGTMARLPQLAEFAKKHGFKIGTISDLIEHRLKTTNLLNLTTTKTMQDGSKVITFKETEEDLDHFAIIYGNPNNAPVRIQSFNLMDEITGELQLGMLEHLKKEYKDLVFIIINNGRNWKPEEKNVRDYGKGAEILKHLGITEVRLLTRKLGRNFAGISGFGINIIEEILI